MFVLKFFYEKDCNKAVEEESPEPELEQVYLDQEGVEVLCIADDWD